MEVQTHLQVQETVLAECQLQAQVENFIKKGSMNSTQGLTLSIPGLKRLRKENGLELKVSLDYSVPKNNKKALFFVCLFSF